MKYHSKYDSSNNLNHTEDIKMKRISMHFTERLVEWLKERAKNKGISFAEEVRHILFMKMEQVQEKNNDS